MGVERRVNCSVHGGSQPAFVCTHLHATPEQDWYCDFPTKKQPFPDAWCAECEAMVEREDGWSDLASEFADIKLICGQCYLGLQSRSVPVLEDKVREDWGTFVGDCRQSLSELQQSLKSRFDIGSYERYDYDQANKKIIFSNQGKPGLIADFEVVGTFSRPNGTWMWSWANFSLMAKVRTRMKRVRELGEQRQFPRLTTFHWSGDECDAWDMAAIASQVLRAQGVYRSPGESSDMFMTLSKIRRVDTVGAVTP